MWRTDGPMNRRLLYFILVTLLPLAVRAQLVAVGTDVASDVLMIPCVGVEVVTGNRSSVSLNVSRALKPWWNKDDTKATIIQPEYRYYFSGRPISKWFLGVGGIGAVYDVTWKDKVYDGYALGGGITFGYVHNLSDRLSIDFHSGFGAIYYRRKEYFVHDNFDTDYTVNGAEQANARGYYLLPTRIGVSVTSILK